MFQHFLKFENETQAKSMLPSWINEDGEWERARVIPNQKVILQRADFTMSANGEMTQTTPEITVPGWYMTITLDVPNQELRELANNACRVIGHYATGEIIYLAPDVDSEVMKDAIIEPTLMGSKYKF